MCACALLKDLFSTTPLASVYLLTVHKGISTTLSWSSAHQLWATVQFGSPITLQLSSASPSAKSTIPTSKRMTVVPALLKSPSLTM